ncbi:MAG: WYL domain-containing protein [Deltaproteobacteria bacterium]|nr:WYL domain-containing protein [Deltaproteobacteria bacterium]
MSQLQERVRRALLLVPLVAQRPEGIPIEELAGRLGIEAEALAEELDFLLMVGRPPFSPADFLDLYLEAGRVHADLSLSLDRPLRLTHDEALALAVGAQTVLHRAGPEFAAQVEGALSRLEAAMSDAERARYLEARERIRAGAMDGAGGDLHAILAAAIMARQAVTIDYFSAHRDARRERVVHPYGLYSEKGDWYLVAGDPEAPPAAGAGEEHDPYKVFRLDRMGEARPAGEAGAFEVPEGILDSLRSRGLLRSAADAVARVRVGPQKARFAAEQVAAESCTFADDGSVEIVFPLASAEWVSAWVLSFAPHARVLAPEALAQKVREDARRALARHR